MDYPRIGREMKARFPGLWDDDDDEAVGRAAVKNGAYIRASVPIAVSQSPPTPTNRNNYEPPTINRPAPPTPAFFFPGKQAEYVENQAKHVEAQVKLANVQDGAAAAREMNARAIDHNLKTQPARLEETNAAAVSAHDTNMVVQSATRQLTREALNRGLDVPTFNLVRLEEEKVGTELHKASGLAEIDIKKQRKMKDIELDARMQEIQMDVQAALTVALVDKHKLLHIQDHVLKLIERSYQIQTGTEADEVKKAKLEVMDEVITGLRQELRGLLQGNSQKGLENGDADRCSP